MVFGWSSSRCEVGSKVRARLSAVRRKDERLSGSVTSAVCAISPTSPFGVDCTPSDDGASSLFAMPAFVS